MKNRKLILALVVYLFCSATLLVAAQHRSKNSLPNGLVRQLIADINDNKNNFLLSDKDLEILHKHLKFELRDLNSDKVSEFFLYIDHSDWCGAGSNCSYWIYQKTKNGYSLLVEDKTFRVRKTITNGYQDLQSESKAGSCEGGFQYYVTPYKYDGRQYQAGKPKDECRTYKPKRN